MRRLAMFVLLAGCGGDVTFDPGTGNWPTPEVPSWAHQGRFAITDNLSDAMSFVTDVAQIPQLLGTMPLGNVPVELEGPHHLAVSPDGKFIYYNLSNYVPGTGSGPHGSHGLGTVPGSLVKLDAATNARLGEAIVDRSPGDVVLSPDGKTAFVSHYDLIRLTGWLTSGGAPELGWSTVAVVDTESMTRLANLPVCVTAHGLGLSTDGKTLYVSCAQADELVVLDVTDRANPAIKLRLPVGPSPGMPGQPIYGPYALTVAASDGTVWVSDNNAGDVRVFDPKTMKMDPMRTIAVGGVAMFGEFSSDGKTYYVPHQGDDVVTAIDTTTLAKRDLPLPRSACLNTHALKLAPGGKLALVVCEGNHQTTNGTIVTVGLEAFVVEGFVEVGRFPDGLAWLPPIP